ncbi:MAG: hypothetical protein NC041_10285, partial [Bacteroides sp.]|nr:hypothetical protein [Bacteroides sp.]
IAALLAAAALIFGGLFCSCSDDPEETTGGNGDGTELDGGNTGNPGDNGEEVITVYTLDAAKFTEITTKIPEIDAPKTPESSDTETTAFIKALSMQLGENMKIDSNRFNAGGSLQAKGKNAVIFIAPTGTSKIEVHFYNNGANNGGRILKIAEYSEDSNFTATDGKKETVANSKEDIVEEFDITAGKKYMLGGSNGVYITKFIIK